MYQANSSSLFSIRGKTLFTILAIFTLSACSSQMNEETLDSQDVSLETPTSVQDSSPSFVDKLLAENAALPEHEQALAITRYEYKGEIVYLLTPPCCDFFSKLYNSEGVLLGSPGGGLSGKGDGTLADFDELKTNAYGLWKKGK